MKRAAAIIGATPPFIRWALTASCPLMRVGGTAAQHRSPAESAWRQLRGLKEISRAMAEGRSHGGYCFAPQSTVKQILAVKIDEVTAPLGGTPRVAQTCHQCPANPTPHLERWAACTGLLPLVSPCETLEETRAAWIRRRSEIETRSLANSGESTPRLGWARVWNGPALTQLELAQALLMLGVNLFREQAGECAELLAALEHAKLSGLKLWVEPVPAGWSDGHTWSLPEFCRSCGTEWLGHPGSGVCANCGHTGSYQAPRKLKVLGLRPYLQLSQTVGVTAAEQLQREYEATRTRRDYE